MYDLLNHNMAQNNLSDVRTYSVALSNVHGFIRMDRSFSKMTEEMSILI